MTRAASKCIAPKAYGDGVEPCGKPCNRGESLCFWCKQDAARFEEREARERAAASADYPDFD